MEYDKPARSGTPIIFTALLVLILLSAFLASKI